jgi:hypothetical protein
MFREIWPVISDVARHHEFRARSLHAVARSERLVLRMGYSGYGDRDDHCQAQQQIKQILQHIKQILLDSAAARGLAPHRILVVQDSDCL